jgi:tetratricopeptide (TPR) repeat protein
LTDLGQAEEAIPHLKQALSLQPKYARAHLRLGLALYELGQSQSAIDQLNEANRLRPDDVEVLWHTAWILATSSDPAIRNGARGVGLATRAIQLSEGRESHAFDALAAALAETEKFPAAVEAAKKGAAAASARDDNALVDAIEQRTRLYRQGLPYRQPPLHLPAEQHAPPSAAQ